MEEGAPRMNPRSLPLAELLSGLPHSLLSGPADVRIADIVCDSRKATPGALLVCASGYPADRHEFIGRAYEAGAVAAVAEAGRVFTAPQGMAVAVVPDTRAALADLSVQFWDRPSERLRLYGVTGTN